jgi:hypothetical protein
MKKSDSPEMQEVFHTPKKQKPIQSSSNSFQGTMPPGLRRKSTACPVYESYHDEI